MVIVLYLLGRTLWRSVGLFLLLEGLWTLAAVFEVARQEPILAGWGLVHLVPVVAVYGAGPWALTALCGGVAGTFADLGHHRELVAASAAGIGPLRWILPVVALGLLVTPWSLRHQAVEFPRARAAREASVQLLLRSPEVCLRLLQAEPSLVEGMHVDLRAEERGRFGDFWAVEPGADGLPSGLWYARGGSVAVPPERDVIRFRLEGLAVARRAPPDGVDVFSAEDAQLERSPGSPRTFGDRGPSTARDHARESTLAELGELSRSLPDGEARRLVRAERGARLALGLAPLPLALAAAAVGLLVSRRGAWIGTLAGIALVAAVYLPLHATCVRWVAGGAPAIVFALPALLPTLAGVPVLRAWRSG